MGNRCDRMIAVGTDSSRCSNDIGIGMAMTSDNLGLGFRQARGGMTDAWRKVAWWCTHGMSTSDDHGGSKSSHGRLMRTLIIRVVFRLEGRRLQGILSTNGSLLFTLQIFQLNYRISI